MTDPTCTATQTAIDQRDGGATLSAQQQRLVTDHLPSCPRCGAFARTTDHAARLLAARTAVLRREVDASRITASVLAAIRTQKRGMVRGVRGLFALFALCVALFAWTGNPAILWPAAGLVAICGAALVGDMARLELTRRWGETAVRLDPAAVRAERRAAIVKVLGAVLLMKLPSRLAEWGIPESVATVIGFVVNIAGLVGVFHYMLVIRDLNRELTALED